MIIIRNIPSRIIVFSLGMMHHRTGINQIPLQWPTRQHHPVREA